MVKDFGVAVRPDSVGVEFDEGRLVANAGVVLTSTLISRLGLERLVDQTVDLGQRPGAARPGRKVCSLVHAMALGADSIDDCDVLRAGGTEALLGHRVMAPSTLGTFLRSFSFGHVRQLDRVLAESIRRAWAAGAGPGRERLVIEIDSFVGEVHGSQKQGAGFGYTGERGYHPILATRSGTARCCMSVCARGRRARDAARFASCKSWSPECVARRQGEILIRADSAFWNKKVLAYLAAKGCRYSIGVTVHKIVTERIALIPEQAWQSVPDYPKTGVCELAETTLRRRTADRPPRASPRPGRADRALRLLAALRVRDQPQRGSAHGRPRASPARRGRARDPRPQRPSARPLPLRPLRSQPAWTVIACLAHNLQRWTGMLGLHDPTPQAARTIRRWLLTIPGRLTRTARQWTLHLPARWPWQPSFIEALPASGRFPPPPDRPPRSASPPLRAQQGCAHPSRDPLHAGSGGLAPCPKPTAAPNTNSHSHRNNPDPLNTTGKRWIEA